MNGTYLAIINNELFMSKDRVTWLWVNNSVFSKTSNFGWSVCYNDVCITYQNGLYKMHKSNCATLYSHNGRYWI